MSEPLVSIIMPVYNCASFLGDAIQSMLNQTFGDFELIIIDDASTDATVNIINSYRDQRITLVKKESNTGLIASLNIGLTAARGEYIARMDGDDISHPQRLEKQVSFMEANTHVVLCGSWYQLAGTNQVVELPVSHEAIKIALLDYCSFAHPTVMLRRQFFIDNNLQYDNAFVAAEDYELWTRVIRIGTTANIPEPLLYYRRHDNQVTATNQPRQVANSNLCREKMLSYALDHPSENDLTNCKTVVNNTRVKKVIELRTITEWLNAAFARNKQTGFYDEWEFGKYIQQKKAMFVRNYYLHTSSYSPGVFWEFNKSYSLFRECFTLKEYLKFLLKCLAFRKHRSGATFSMTAWL
ncbi:MAG TPA: glycosyltransferase family 2 protein [Mucilaginibacter sp.]